MRDAQFRDRYGPYALVAGGSVGLGAAFGEAIARRGVNLILIARDATRLTATAERIAREHGVDAVPIAADMADWDAVRAKVAALDHEIGLLVYDAAYAPIGPFAEATEDQLAQVAAVNVQGPMLLARLLAEPMVERGRGGIVLMSSLAGAQGSPNIAAYAATKSFNTTLAEGLWRELKPHGVDVLACVAGAISTPGYQQAEQSQPAPGTLAADAVAERTLSALGRGPVVVPGALNKVGRFVMARLLTRKAAIALMSNNTGSLS